MWEGIRNEAVLISAIISSGQSARFNISRCKKCHFASGKRVITKSLRRANKILSLFGISERVSALVEENTVSLSLREKELYSRRKFFSCLQGGMQSRMTVATESINTDWHSGARTKVTLEPRLPKKRLLLLEQVKKLGQPVTADIYASNLPFAEVEIGAGCNGCGMCATFCPTGALKSYDQGSQQVIDFAPAYCLACKLCSEICPEVSIVYSPYVNLHDLIANRRRILIEHRKSACQRCGHSHIAVAGSNLCLNCRKERVVEEWLAKIWKQS